ncbi:hypothetical protein BGX26_012241 [Mortierella sp. AD094]|nr:hypothetical protein BGX26_012241 [Mortierella sp. AD094]
MRNQYFNSHNSRLSASRPLCFAVLLFVFLNLITLHTTTTEAAPVLLVPRRSPLVSAILGSRGGRRGGNGGTGIGIGSGGSGLLLKLHRPFIPREDSEGDQTELENELQRVDETGQVVGLTKRKTSSRSSKADSSNADEVKRPHRTYKTLPLEPSVENPQMVKRDDSVDERDYIPKGTGSGGNYDKNTPYGRK